MTTHLETGQRERGIQTFKKKDKLTAIKLRQQKKLTIQGLNCPQEWEIKKKKKWRSKNQRRPFLCFRKKKEKKKWTLILIKDCFMSKTNKRLAQANCSREYEWYRSKRGVPENTSIPSMKISSPAIMEAGRAGYMPM